MAQNRVNRTRPASGRHLAALGRSRRSSPTGPPATATGWTCSPPNTSTTTPTTTSSLGSRPTSGDGQRVTSPRPAPPRPCDHTDRTGRRNQGGTMQTNATKERAARRQARALRALLVHLTLYVTVGLAVF